VRLALDPGARAPRRGHVEGAAAARRAPGAARTQVRRSVPGVAAPASRQGLRRVPQRGPRLTPRCPSRGSNATVGHLSRPRPTVITLALTPGEPAGIGPDIVARLAGRTLPARVVVVADRGLLAERARRLGIAL